MASWLAGGYFLPELLMKRVEYDTEFRTVQSWKLIGGEDFFLHRLPLDLPSGFVDMSSSSDTHLATLAPAQSMSRVTAQATPSPRRGFASVSDAFHHPSRTSALDATGTESTGSSYNPSLQVCHGMDAISSTDIFQTDLHQFNGGRATRYNALERGREGSPGQVPGYANHWDNRPLRNDEIAYHSNGAVPASPATSLSQPSYGAPLTPAYGAIGGPRVSRDPLARRTSIDIDAQKSLGSSALNSDAYGGDIGLGRPGLGQIGGRSRQASYASERAWANEVSAYTNPSRGLNVAPVSQHVLRCMLYKRLYGISG